ncbi:hypothetical protein P4O66_016408, partial [Electrophorus voltai]
VMSAEYGLFDLAVVSLRDSEQEGDSGMKGNADDHLYNMDFQTNKSKDPDLNGSTFSYTNGTMNMGSSSELTTTGELKVCSVHELPLDRYCSTEGKLTCSLCVTRGSCQGHRVTELVVRATAVRNQLVDICEKMQLQSLRIERFIKHTLTAKERAVQVEASIARERVVAQVNSVREALEEEEQRLLEAVQREQERVEQCLLTQQVHWNKALDTLTQARTRLVHTLTHSTDAALMVTHSLISLRFDERTVSPLLSLSPDGHTLTFIPKRRGQAPPYDPARFDSWPNALCSYALSSGTHAWLLEVGTSAAFKVGVCYSSMGRKGSGNDARLGYNAKSWVLSHYDGNFSFCHSGCNVAIAMVKRPSRVGLLLDWSAHTLLFYDPDSKAVLHAVRQVFSEPLLPACAVADQSISIVH